MIRAASTALTIDIMHQRPVLYIVAALGCQLSAGGGRRIDANLPGAPRRAIHMGQHAPSAACILHRVSTYFPASMLMNGSSRL